MNFGHAQALLNLDSSDPVKRWVEAQQHPYPKLARGFLSSSSVEFEELKYSEAFKQHHPLAEGRIFTMGTFVLPAKKKQDPDKWDAVFNTFMACKGESRRLRDDLR